MKTTKAVIMVPSHDLINRGQETVDVLTVEDGAKKEDIENIDWEMIMYSKKQWTKELAIAYVQHWLQVQKEDSTNKESYPDVLEGRRKFLKDLLISKLESNVDFMTIVSDFNLMATMSTEART
ncbi:MAG: hypothetical protein V3U54_08595 [Thermodesulfobacteriota bacterium]